VDGCERKFVVNESGIEEVDIDSPQLLLSGEVVVNETIAGITSMF
jgi:hypothetical protein